MTAAGDLPVTFGRFKLMCRIGFGGMGEVYLAREENGRNIRACVVKKVLPELAKDPAFIRRFLDEAKVVIRLDHPNIARVYSVGEVGGEYYLAMEYVQGKTIFRFTRRLREQNRTFPLGLIVYIGEQVCRGLAHAHNATDQHAKPLNLVHRDLSPANVCVSYDGSVKVIDFGAAYSAVKAQRTSPRIVIGNLTYMSPEQAQKKYLDGRADVYAAGVLLWELITWRQLLQGRDQTARWRQAMEPVWEPCGTYREGVPPELDAAVLHALSPELERRFASATAFGDALAEVRAKYFPESNSDELAKLICEEFSEEKLAEDALVQEILRGVPLDDEPTDRHPAIIAYTIRPVEAPLAIAEPAAKGLRAQQPLSAATPFPPAEMSESELGSPQEPRTDLEAELEVPTAVEPVEVDGEASKTEQTETAISLLGATRSKLWLSVGVLAGGFALGVWLAMHS